MDGFGMGRRYFGVVKTFGNDNMEQDISNWRSLEEFLGGKTQEFETLDGGDWGQ